MFTSSASLKTNKITGDGTKSSHVRFLVTQISNYTKPIECIEHISDVSFISSGDKIISSLITKAINIVGKKGIIFVEESNTVTNEIKIIEGLRFDQGFISGYFTTDNERLQVILKNTYILLTNKKITLVKNELIPILNLILKKKKALLIISDEFEIESLSTLIKNKLKGTINVIAVQVPSFGDCRKTFLSDLAILTDGHIICSAIGNQLKNINIKDLGQAWRVVIEKESTTIVSVQIERCYITT